MKGFLAEATTTINNVANASSRPEVKNLTSAVNNVNFTALKSKFTNFDFDFEKLTMPGLDFNLWLLDVISLGDLFFAVDFIFRVYFTIQLCFKYWDVSAVKTPQIDIRAEKEFAINPFEWSNGQLLIALLSNPLTGILLSSIIISWVAAFTTSIYIPIFDEYKSGCVPTNANGTFISENFYSSSYNYAYNEGSSSLIENLERLETAKMNTCSSMFPSSVAKQNDDARQIQGDSQLIPSIQHQIGLIEKCVDIDTADAYFDIACCDKLGYGECDEVNNTFDFVCPINHNLDPPIPYLRPGKKIHVHIWKCSSGLKKLNSMHCRQLDRSTDMQRKLRRPRLATA